MKRIICIIIFLFLLFGIHAQQQHQVTAKELTDDVQFLASDSLLGRRNYTTQILSAAEYIAASFRKDSLLFMEGAQQYIIPFNPHGKLKKKWMDVKGNYDPERVLYNVVARIEGRSKPDELVIFSAHFDHIGDDGGSDDPVFNGANDNASGTAAVMALARHYARAANNERTIIFCVFGGEELGLLGSRWLSLGIKPEFIKAMINIEMIGSTNVAGPDHFFLTGASYSNLDEIILKNLEGSPVKMVDDPAPEKYLFARSDNFPFAERSVPAHTIMSSNDFDECYHAPCDEWERLDYGHMKNIVEAIITGTRTIIDGTDTPQRIRRSIENPFR